MGDIRICWFTQGDGFGHAIADLAIIKNLQAIVSNLSILFVSHAHGAQALERSPYPVIDLGLPAKNPFFETLVRAGRIIHAYRPTMVVSHEELAALPVSQIFNRPNLFITRQFLKAEHFLTQGLVCADHILFIEDSGHFAVPPHLATKLTFVGPVVRSFAYTSQDRLRARQELGIDDSTKVVSVFFDAQSGIGVPVFQIVLDAFDKLPLINKVLIWVAGSDTRRLQRRIGNRTDVLIKESDWQIDRLMVATDLAITKANYTTVLELDTLGVPSIGLLNGHNPVDEFYTRQRPSVIPLELSSLSVGMLTQRMISLLTSSFPIDKEDFDPTVRAIGTVRAAERIASYLSEFAPIPR